MDLRVCFQSLFCCLPWVYLPLYFIVLTAIAISGFYLLSGSHKPVSESSSGILYSPAEQWFFQQPQHWHSSHSYAWTTRLTQCQSNQQVLSLHSWQLCLNWPHKFPNNNYKLAGSPYILFLMPTSFWVYWTDRWRTRSLWADSSAFIVDGSAVLCLLCIVTNFTSRGILWRKCSKYGRISDEEAVSKMPGMGRIFCRLDPVSSIRCPEVGWGSWQFKTEPHYSIVVWIWSRRTRARFDVCRS